MMPLVRSDASDASWADHPTADVKGDLPVSHGSLESEKSHVRTIDFSVIVDDTPMPLAA